MRIPEARHSNPDPPKRLCDPPADTAPHAVGLQTPRRTGGFCLHGTSANCRRVLLPAIGIVEQDDTAVRQSRSPCREMIDRPC